MPHTLVTGANSFVAAHVINELISEGHTVTGTVRRLSAGEAVLKEHLEWQGKLDFVTVDDYAKDGVFDSIFQNQQFDHIVHVAAPMVGKPELNDYERDFYRPSVEGNLSLLRSAKAHAPTLKSIAVTGSINANTMGSAEENRTKKYTNESWNELTREYAQEAGNGYVSYCASKKAAEEAIWDFVKNEKPDFAVSSTRTTLNLAYD